MVVGCLGYMSGVVLFVHHLVDCHRPIGQSVDLSADSVLYI